MGIASGLLLIEFKVLVLIVHAWVYVCMYVCIIKLLHDVVIPYVTQPVLWYGMVQSVNTVPVHLHVCHFPHQLDTYRY